MHLFVETMGATESKNDEQEIPWQQTLGLGGEWLNCLPKKENETIKVPETPRAPHGNNEEETTAESIGAFVRYMRYALMIQTFPF